MMHMITDCDQRVLILGCVPRLLLHVAVYSIERDRTLQTAHASLKVQHTLSTSGPV